MTFLHCRLLVTLSVLSCLALAATPGSARAAHSYDSCTGFIDSLPATISTQGTWCLRSHLSTNVTSGNAITIAANNVTLDCNDFRVGGLAAGNASYTNGIYARDRQNTTVRHCNIRGFLSGVAIQGGAGHLIQGNRLDNNLRDGIYITADNSLVQGNRIYDTGGGTGLSHTWGIWSSTHVVDNIVSGLFVDDVDGQLYGIAARGDGNQIRDNTVSGFDAAAGQGGTTRLAHGIRLLDARMRASGNQVVGDGTNNIPGMGIYTYRTSSYCLDNTVGGFQINIDSRCNSSGNLTSP